VLDRILRLLHPYTPFITEELWGRLNAALGRPASLIATYKWPAIDEAPSDHDAERRIEARIEAVRELRNIRNKYAVPPKQEIEAVITAADEGSLAPFKGADAFFKAMANVSKLTVGLNAAKPKGSASASFGTLQAFVPGLFDSAAELRAHRDDPLEEAAARGRQEEEARERVLQAEGAGHVGEGARVPRRARGRDRGPRALARGARVRVTEAVSELESLVDFGIELAREAGKIMMAGLGHAHVQKKSWRDLVTEVDEACERHVITRIKVALPDHDYFAEEGHRRSDKKSPGAGSIDPLDGTTNFAHGLPPLLHLDRPRARWRVPGSGRLRALHERALLRLEGRRSVPQLAVDPDPRERVLAALRIGPRDRLLLRPEGDDERHLANFARITREARGTRRFGVRGARPRLRGGGRLDGFWEMHLKPYDVAAGAVLIREAGGRVTDFFGGDDWLEGQTFVGTNGKIHEALRSRLDPVQPDGHVRIPGETTK